ncbi:MAG: flagellar M-ring protein FliF [Candidatus Hydrogenedentota bacterium]|nr:MAG: flagellar M-ring protein FliF [Candidatus Hydrogenedentota bacterium]
MLDFFRQLLAGIVDAWRRLSINARVQIGLVGLLTIALLMGTVYMGSQPQYAQLYNRLEMDESSQIVAWLAENNIPYQLKDGGQRIDISAKEISHAKVSLASLNLPKSQGVAPGFELFNTRDLMSNQYLQNVDYTRAVMGELQRQLNSFDFIRNSSVFIREAPEQLFSSQQKPSEASVILDVTGGPLSKSQVKAVLHTISSFGGANLSKNNIVITKTDGTPLHSPVADEFASLAGDKLDYKVALESQREQKIRNGIKQLGRNSIINVSADIDWSSESKTQKELGDKVAVSEMITEMISETAEGPPEGAPGATANIPEATVSGTSQTSLSESEIINNFDIPETLTTTVTGPGRVNKFIVSAIIEGNYGELADGEEGSLPYIPLTQEEILNFTQIISNAVGEGKLPTEVVVFDQAFNLNQMVVASAVPGVSSSLFQSRWLTTVLQGFLVLAAFLVIRLFMRRAMVLPTLEEQETVEIPELSPDEQRRHDMAAEVERLSQEEPETVAALLRTWMAMEEK